MTKGHDKGHKGQMSDREVMRLALEALERSMEAGMTGIKVDQAIAALRQALAEPDMGIDRGAWDDVPDATKWVDELRGDEPWDTSDMAYRPNGLNMEQEPVTWRNAAIRLGEYLYSVGPNGYYDMTASQWLDWALSVVNIAPQKREWIGLTDEEIDYIWGVTKPDYENFFDFPRAIEAKLKEKNRD